MATPMRFAAHVLLSHLLGDCLWGHVPSLKKVILAFDASR